MTSKNDAPWPVPRKGKFSLSDMPTKLEKFKGGNGQGDMSVFERLNKLQNTMYASKTQGLLLVLQGMDTAGKDGVIRHVFSHISPLGVRAQAFAAPSEEEKRHDFLWRIHSKLPGKGEMVIFNRSHYEDVLVPMVRGGMKKATLQKRLEHICHFEAMLQDEGIAVLKCYLHISKAEQKKRLQARMDDPQKQWKLQASDFEDRKRWPSFMQAYEETMQATSTKQSPWFIVPADDKSQRDHLLAELLVNTLEDMKLTMPKPTLKPGSLKLI